MAERTHFHFNLSRGQLEKLASEQAEEIKRLEGAISSALTSLATGPAKDGYAYAVLDAALSEKQDG